MSNLLQDLQYGLRMLAKNPGFSLAAIITLALGIGATTALFSVMMAVLIRPMPFRETDSLVTIQSKNPAMGINQANLTASDIIDFQQQSESFEQISAWTTLPINLKGAASPERLEGILVNSNFFQTLGAQPLIGRTFIPDDASQNENSVIISYGLWQRQFGGDPGVIGQKSSQSLPYLFNQNSVIIGVMPKDFQFPPRTDVWLTLDFEATENRGGSHDYRTIARLKPDVTFEQAQAELSAIAQHLAEEYPDTNRGWEISLLSMREYLFGNARIAIPLLLTAVCFLLLIACINVANLQLSRALAKQKEAAIRLALGASRWRIVRQSLSESLLLALIGGAIGLLVAMWCIEAFQAIGRDTLLRLQDASINWQAVLFSSVVAITTGLLSGIFPALQMSNSEVSESLKETNRSQTSSKRSNRFRNLLIASQTALAFVLLVGAGLLIKSFWKLSDVNPGFETENILTAGVSLNWSDYPNGDPRRAAFYTQALERIATLQSVQSVGAISHLPLGGRGVSLSFSVAGESRLPAKNQLAADLRVISPSYFEAIGIPLLEGRSLSGRDDDKAPRAIVVNQSFARSFFADGDPVGRRLKIGQDLFEGEIVGVVGDVKHRGLENEAKPEIYISYLQNALWPVMNFVIRTSSDPIMLGRDVRRELQSIDPNQPVFNVRSMEEFLSDSTAQRRFNLLLLTAFAGLAIALAAAGIYGVISYLAAQRSREMGIRIALGAQKRDVLILIVGQGIKFVFAGIVSGIIAALALSQLMMSLLYGVSATDPLTFIVVAVLLTLVALVASYLPARRAARVDPIAALRYE